tara:strand:- start:6506 stop:7750 length:1245 start_codon:yes stop_codon:yes gene_type:complete
MRFLIVTDSIDINDSSGSKANVALIQNLHKAGFGLKVYHYTRKDISLKGIPYVAVQEQKATVAYILSKLQLTIKRFTGWNANTYVEKKRGFSFAFFNDSYSIQKALQAENPEDYDRILTLSKAGSFRPHKALLGLPQWHSKWLAYIHDPYPMHSYPRPYDWVEPGHQKKRNFFLQIAHACRYALYPSQLLAEWMEGYYKPLQGKAVIIPHQLSEMSFKKVQLPSFFNKNHFNILHAGTLLWGRDPHGLLQGFTLFLEKYPEAKGVARLLFLGGKNHYSDLLEEYAEKFPQVYVSEDYVPFEQVYALQQLATVNVILEAKGPISPFLPGKFPHCVAADRPILLLGPYYSESKRLLGEDYPYVAAIDEAEKIAGYLSALYKSWKEQPDTLRLNRPHLTGYLSEEHLIETFSNLKHL